MASSDKSLILGVATGYQMTLLMPFLKSLRAANYVGKLCLFVSGMKAESVAETKLYADKVIVLDGIYGSEITRYRLEPYKSLLAKVRKTRFLRRMYPALFRRVLRLVPEKHRKHLQWDLEQSLEGFQSLRNKHYWDYIAEFAPSADYILLTDVRDVIFQGDPFHHVVDNDLEVFLEAKHLTLGGEPFNRRWIQHLYGKEMLTAIGSSTVSCSGTTMGTRAGILRYLGAMTKEIARHERPLGSHDQGVHNYLLRNHHLDPVTIYDRGTGPVLTIGMDNDIQQNVNGCLLNNDGSIPAVVHQYDRHPDLASKLLKSIPEDLPW